MRLSPAQFKLIQQRGAKVIGGPDAEPPVEPAVDKTALLDLEIRKYVSQFSRRLDAVAKATEQIGDVVQEILDKKANPSPYTISVERDKHDRISRITAVDKDGTRSAYKFVVQRREDGKVSEVGVTPIQTPAKANTVSTTKQKG